MNDAVERVLKVMLDGMPPSKLTPTYSTNVGTRYVTLQRIVSNVLHPTPAWLCTQVNGFVVVDPTRAMSYRTDCRRDFLHPRQEVNIGMTWKMLVNALGLARHGSHEHSSPPATAVAGPGTFGDPFNTQ